MDGSTCIHTLHWDPNEKRIVCPCVVRSPPPPDLNYGRPTKSSGSNLRHTFVILDGLARLSAQSCVHGNELPHPNMRSPDSAREGRVERSTPTLLGGAYARHSSKGCRVSCRRIACAYVPSWRPALGGEVRAHSGRRAGGQEDSPTTNVCVCVTDSLSVCIPAGVGDIAWSH